jgi:hypothetical protein
MVLADAETVSSNWNMARIAGERPHDAFELVSLLQLRPQIGVFGLEAPLLQRRVEGMQQLVELEGLRHEVDGAAADGVHRVLYRPIAGHDDADNVRIPEERCFQHPRAVKAGKAEVSDDDVEGKFCELLDGMLASVGLFHLESMFGQALRQRLSERGFVFNKQEMFFRFSHLGERQHNDAARGISQEFSGDSSVSRRSGQDAHGTTVT